MELGDDRYESSAGGDDHETLGIARMKSANSGRQSGFSLTFTLVFSANLPPSSHLHFGQPAEPAPRVRASVRIGSILGSDGARAFGVRAGQSDGTAAFRNAITGCAARP